MGWRAWDAYEREAQERWKALPWRERCDWRAIISIAAVAIVAAALWCLLR